MNYINKQYQASNFYRLFYLCEKNSVETIHGKQNSQTRGEDLVIQLDQAKEMKNQQQQNQMNNSSNNKSSSFNSSGMSNTTLLGNSSLNSMSNNNNLNNNIENNSNNNSNVGSNTNLSLNQNTSNINKNKGIGNMNSQMSNSFNINNNNNMMNTYNQSEDITFRMIINHIKQVENEVLILSNNLEKYNTAVRYMHELLCQVNEEYRRFCEYQKKINPGPLHIKRIEKFNLEPELIFISTKDMANKNSLAKESNIQKGDSSDKGGGGGLGYSSQFSLPSVTNNNNNSNNNNSNNNNNNNNSNNNFDYNNISMQIEQTSSFFSNQTGSGGGQQDIQQKLQS